MAPYGVAKEHGGDSAENDAKMERCIRHVMQTRGKMDHVTAKVHAIRICKSGIFGKKK